MAIIAGVDFGKPGVRVSIVDPSRGIGLGSFRLSRPPEKDDPDYATQSHDHMRALSAALRRLRCWASLWTNPFGLALLAEFTILAKMP